MRDGLDRKIKLFRRPTAFSVAEKELGNVQANSFAGTIAAVLMTDEESVMDWSPFLEIKLFALFFRLKQPGHDFLNRLLPIHLGQGFLVFCSCIWFGVKGF